MGSRQHFGGKLYYWHSSANTRSEANNLARYLRKHGYLARVTRNVGRGGRFIVWRRKVRGA